MRPATQRLAAALDAPLGLWPRAALVAAAACIALAYLFPLWRIGMIAPQYPKGLRLDVYLYKLEGGNQGRDVAEINSLNHYIGMAPISRADLGELDWMPFAFGLLILLILRSAVLGNGRDLVDVNVLAAFVAASAMFRFAYKLYQFGHNLDPRAAFRVEPFMPVLLGRQQVANFETWAYPQLGGGLIAGATLLLALAAIRHFRATWSAAGRTSPAAP